jgi:hypothetical protein
MLIGTPFERIDEEIDFEWEKDPIGGVNVDNFSVRFIMFDILVGKVLSKPLLLENIHSKFTQMMVLNY